MSKKEKKKDKEQNVHPIYQDEKPKKVSNKVYEKEVGVP